MATHGTCDECEKGILGDEHIEWLGQEATTGPEIAVRFEEVATCCYCGHDHILREGTGYWSQESWDHETEADRLVYDPA